MRISRTIEIMFEHKPSRSISICKVDASRLNWKLRKLQNEGMYIIGVLLIKESNFSTFNEELFLRRESAPQPPYSPRYYPPLDVPTYHPPDFGKTAPVKDAPPQILLNDASDRCTDEAVQKEENGC